MANLDTWYSKPRQQRFLRLRVLTPSVCRAADCTPCPAGKYSTTSAEECIACEAGKFTEEPGETGAVAESSCTACTERGESGRGLRGFI